MISTIMDSNYTQTDESSLLTNEGVKKIKVNLNWSRVSRGRASEELYDPSGLAICKKTGDIYVTDSGADRIQVFNREGCYRYSICDKQYRPTFHYIAIHKQYIIISCINPTRVMIRTCHHGYHVTSFRLDNVLSGIDVDRSGSIYIIEMLTQQVCILENCGTESVRKLKLIDPHYNNNDTSYDISRKVGQDIKLTAEQDKFYVLFGLNNFFLELYDMQGIIVSRLIGHDMIVWSKSFCVNNSSGNIVIADKSGNQIKVFNSDGKLLKAIGEKGLEKAGYFYFPFGIDIGYNGNIVVCDCKQNYMLQSFEVKTN